MIPTIIGPPATPKYMGTLIPGKEIGIAPNTTPSTIPRKILPKLGSLRVCTALPINRSTSSRALGAPTTTTRSPYCKRRSSVANSFISPRITRLTLTPYTERNCRSIRCFPLSTLRVTTIVRLATLLSIWFQSILSAFQLAEHSLPKSISIALRSFLLVTTNTRSFLCSSVLAQGTITSFSRHTREMIKRSWALWAKSLIFLPSRAGLTTSYSPI